MQYLKNKLNQWIAFIDRERGDLLEMAKKMKRKNMQIEEIIELTGLTKEQVESLT